MGPSMSVSLSVASFITLFWVIVASITLDTIVAFDTIIAFVFPLVALLTSSLVMQPKEHLSNFSVLQRVPIFPILFEFSVLHFPAYRSAFQCGISGNLIFPTNSLPVRISSHNAEKKF
jgi:hypothetical protein